MSNVLKSLLTFILGWVLLYLFLIIFGRDGDINFMGIVFSIFYLCSVIMYIGLNILDKIDTLNASKKK